MQIKLIEHNKNKLIGFATDSGKTAGWWALGGAVVGGILGGVVGGPLGLMAGAAQGAALTGATSATVSLANVIAD